MTVHRVRGRAIALVLTVVTAVFGLVAVQNLPVFSSANAPAASAISGNDFVAGNIISDSDFYNGNAMSQSQIQSFLDSHIGTCQNGQCLNVLTTSVAGRSRLVSDTTGNVRCEAFAGGTLTAAAIIYQAQVACGISAEVILVTLEKEEGLVTSNAPSQPALDRAMGFACPDTAPCAPTSLGFGNQVYMGTLQLKTYKASNFGIQPGVHSILYSQNGCGASNVNIQDYATAALYNYTPYQPDPAALANINGNGDGCSSYGNRNFWVYFTTWFGIHVEPGPISDLYDTMNDSSGPLGAVAANVESFSGGGGGTGQRFQNGSIMYSAATGAVAILNGPLRDEYFAEGGPSGPLGWPAAAIEPYPGGTGQRFQNGSIMASAAGAFSIPNGTVRDMYWAAGGPAGTYGWPTASQVCSGTLCSQTFQHGTIDLNPISILHNSMGGNGGVLGAAQAGIETFTGSGGGTGQRFAHGSIMSSPTAGTWAIMDGALRDEYFALGGPSSTYGWPTAAQVCVSGSCTQTFQGGTLPGPIDTLYNSLGGASGALGVAQAGIESFTGAGGGTGERFAHGSIMSSPAAGTWAIMNGPLRDKYFAAGGPSSAYGWPTGAQTCTATQCTQHFQGGTITG